MNKSISRWNYNTISVHRKLTCFSIFSYNLNVWSYWILCEWSSKCAYMLHKRLHHLTYNENVSNFITMQFPQNISVTIIFWLDDINNICKQVMRNVLLLYYSTTDMRHHNSIIYWLRLFNQNLLRPRLFIATLDVDIGNLCRNVDLDP